jgi:prophage maintenance system killer protein
MTIRRITLEDAEFIAHRAAVEMMSFIDEPIPPFNTRYKGRLESCLDEPFKTFDGKFLHYTFHERAAVLFYLIARSQCFMNGNKRMAVMLTAIFFFINKRWFSIPPKQLYDIAVAVGKSPDKKMKEDIKNLTKLFKKYEIPTPA